MKGKFRDTGKVRWNLKFEILQRYGTLIRFAEMLGLSKAQLSHIIMGRNPGWHIRKPAAKLLKKSEKYLFGGGRNGNGS